MDRQGRSTHAARTVRRVLTVLALAAAIVAGVANAARAQFNSGSSGKHGTFPPAPENGPIPPDAYFIVWNVLTGQVRYCSSYVLGSGSDQCASGNGTLAQISGFAPGELLTTGVYEFSDFNIAPLDCSGRWVVPINYSPNVPLTILSSGDIKMIGSGCTSAILYVRGENGNIPPAQTPSFSVAGGRGGPGGFDGGASGNGGTTSSDGAAGFGPAGGNGGSASAADVNGHQGSAASGSPVNPSLVPILGGSGGGGAAGIATGALNCSTNSPAGYGGGSGGGGGGALVLAASNSVQILGGAIIEARGGTGGSNPPSNCSLWGNGGAGGSVRIVSQFVTGNGQINIGGGFRPDLQARAAGGYLRVEAALNQSTFSVDGAAGGSYISFPTAPVPANRPLLRITALGGNAAPASARANLANPDITFQQAINTPQQIDVEAHYVPPGTPVTIKVVPAVGTPTQTVTSALAGDNTLSTASAMNVVLPPGAGIVTASATFNLTPQQQGQLFPAGVPVVDGEKPERVLVTTEPDGKTHSYLIARSGARFEFGQSGQ